MIFPTALTVINSNQASVVNNVQVTANTGSNSTQSQNGSSIITGQATALTNVFNLLNFNLIHSNLFITLANILGGWTGNIIFAYPDVSVVIRDAQKEAKPGDVVPYTLTYGNQGSDTATGVTLSLDLPSHFTYQSDTSGKDHNLSNNRLNWTLNNLNPHESHSFTVNLKVDDTFDFKGQASLFPSMVKQAYAADTGLNKSVQIIANINTVDPDSNTFNNTASSTTIVYESIENNDNQPQITDNRLPSLDLQATNNVNQFVHPGDTITFELKLKNTGDVAATNTIITHQIFNSKHQMVGASTFPIDTVTVGKSGTLRFGLVIPKGGSMAGDSYYTLSQASGISPNQQKVYSNQPRTIFAVKTSTNLALISVPTVNAASVDLPIGQILGVQNKLKDVIPYIILSLLSSLWFFQKLRIRRLKLDTNPVTNSLWNSVTASMAYMFIAVVFIFSMYRISTYYGLIKTNNIVATAYNHAYSLLKKQ